MTLDWQADNDAIFGYPNRGALLITPCALDPEAPPKRAPVQVGRGFLNIAVLRILHLKRRHRDAR